MAKSLQQDARASSTPQMRARGRDFVSNGPQRFGCQAGAARLNGDAIAGTRSCIAVVDRFPFTRECIATSLQAVADELDIAQFATVEEAWQDGKRYDLILCCVHPDDPELDGNGFAPSSLDLLVGIAPVIVLSSGKAPDFIVDAFEKGARAYFPIETMTLELAIEILRLVKAGGIFVPRPSRPLRSANAEPAAPAIGQFTARERAVLAHLQHGKANKIIAHALNISESTIKVHIRNIMRKMNVNNRTEVVSRYFAMEWGALVLGGVQKRSPSSLLSRTP